MGELKKDNTEIATGKHMITMSNALTRAGHGLSLPEKRIVFIAISKIDPRKPLPLDMGIYTSRITAAEYAELAGCEMHTAYEALKDAAKALYSRSITFFEPAYKRKGSPLVQVQMRWVGEVHYQAGEGWAELLWWPKLLPHLMGIQGQFSSYQLQQTTALRSRLTLPIPRNCKISPRVVLTSPVWSCSSTADRHSGQLRHQYRLLALTG